MGRSAILEMVENRESVERPLDYAVIATQKIRSELEQLGGWSNPQLGEAMHELIHLSDALAELRAALGTGVTSLESGESTGLE